MAIGSQVAIRSVPRKMGREAGEGDKDGEEGKKSVIRIERGGEND